MERAVGAVGVFGLTEMLIVYAKNPKHLAWIDPLEK